MEGKDIQEQQMNFPQINEETSIEVLTNIISQKPDIRFVEGGFRRDHAEWFAKWDYNDYKIVIETTDDDDDDEEFRVIFNEKARVLDRASEDYDPKRGYLLVIVENSGYISQYHNTLIYSQGLQENTIYLENNEEDITQEQGTEKIDILLKKIYFALYKTKAYALLRNSLREKSLIEENDFGFKHDRNDKLYTGSIDIMLEIIYNLINSPERKDIIDKSNISYMN